MSRRKHGPGELPPRRPRDEGRGREEKGDQVMRDGLRSTLTSITVGIVLAVATTSMAVAQGLITQNQIPRTADSKHNPPCNCQEMNSANYDLEDHGGAPAPSSIILAGAVGAAPPGESVVEGGTIPYPPEDPAQTETQ